MNRIQSILMVTAAAFSVNMAYAQTPADQTGAPTAAAPEVRIVTPTTDPLVQKRNDNALANKEYKENKKQAKEAYKQQKEQSRLDKKTAKTQYKQQVDAAKIDQEQFKKDATTQEKSALQGDAPAAPLQALPEQKQGD